MSNTDAHIYEQGYRRYEGERLGVNASIKSLAVHSMLRGLGLRRTFWAKLLPIAVVLISFLPAAVFVGIAALIPERFTDEIDVIPTYADYFGNISAALILFVAIVGPEVLCSDRKNGMLGMYLASPLRRETYLVSKVLGVAPVLLLVTLGPQLLLLIGRTLVDAGPDGIDGFLLVLLRTLVSGVMLSALYTAISLAAASLTDRRAFASAGVILLILASSAVTAALVEGANLDKRLYLLNLGAFPLELVQRIYGAAGEEPSIATASLVAAAYAWILLSSALIVWRYRKLTISR
jgi:ABC-2 type transport system permease protein